MKSENLNFLEPSGPLQACNGTAAFIKIIIITYLLTYSMEHSPSWEANRVSASQESPSVYGTQNFITAFTSACHLYLSWASSTQSMLPHTTSRRYILILSSYLRLGLPSGLSIRFPYQNPVHTFPLPYTCCISRPSHSSRFDHPNLWGEEYKLSSFTLCSFPHSPVTSSLLGPNNLLSTLFSNTFSLLSSLNVSYHVSHP